MLPTCVLVGAMDKTWKANELRAAIGSLEIKPPDPPPCTWRAEVPRPAVLPHYPMILRRGGYPDGS